MGRRLLWKSSHACSGMQLEHLLLFCKFIGRKQVFINTGVHGDNTGVPRKGDIGFFLGDIQTVVAIPDMNACPHNMTPWSSPVYPEEL